METPVLRWWPRVPGVCDSGVVPVTQESRGGGKGVPFTDTAATGRMETSAAPSFPLSLPSSQPAVPTAHGQQAGLGSSRRPVRSCSIFLNPVHSLDIIPIANVPGLRLSQPLSTCLSAFWLTFIGKHFFLRLKPFVLSIK